MRTPETTEQVRDWDGRDSEEDRQQRKRVGSARGTNHLPGVHIQLDGPQVTLLPLHGHGVLYVPLAKQRALAH
jgi:hypothetical protein